LLLLVLLLAALSLSHAQSVDTIKPNPDAVQLRRVWSVTGGEFGGGRVGRGCSNLGDIFGIGRSAFFISSGDTNLTRIYIWDTATQRPRQMGLIPQHGTRSGRSKLVGDFLGNGRQLLCLPYGEYDSVTGHFFYFLDFFEVSADTILDQWVLRFSDTAMRPPTRINPSDWAAVDLDGDSADELILYMDGLWRNDVYEYHPEVWIFRGGPGFRLDSPTVVLRALEETDQNVRRMWVNDCDGDGRMDIITFGRYKGRIYKLYIYFGREDSPWSWTEPDRIMTFGSSDTEVADLDGNGTFDFLQPSPPGRVLIFRSRTGKSYRDRSLLVDDADNILYGGAHSIPVGVGYLSDSSREYEMLMLAGASPFYFLNGGQNGPDAFYEIATTTEPYVYTGADITGDGWDDLLTTYPQSNFNAGVVTLWAGGPYIPRDASMGVRWVSDGVKVEAIALWPNPAREVVHVAWRGDLTRPPRRLVVTGLDGRRVAEGSVAFGVGEMVWSCGGVPSGTYLCTMLDGNDRAIATSEVVVVR